MRLFRRKVRLPENRLPELRESMLREFPEYSAEALATLHGLYRANGNPLKPGSVAEATVLQYIWGVEIPPMSRDLEPAELRNAVDRKLADGEKVTMEEIAAAYTEYEQTPWGSLHPTPESVRATVEKIAEAGLLLPPEDDQGPR